MPRGKKRTRKFTDAERRERLLPLWLQRPPDQRTGNDVLKFYFYLQEHYYYLLSTGHGDSYQQLKGDLRGYIVEPT